MVFRLPCAIFAEVEVLLTMKLVDTQSEAYRKVHFAVMAIEGSAQKEQISRETATNE